MTVNEAGTRTYLKNYDANAQGERFGVSLVGDLSHTLADDAFISVSRILPRRRWNCWGKRMQPLELICRRRDALPAPMG